MIDTTKEPSATDLRVFAFGLVVLGALFRWWFGIPWLGYGVMAFGVVAIALLFAAPAVLAKVYRGWLRAFAPIALLVSTLVLGLVYFGVVTPLGLLKRTIAGSPLTLEPDREAKTYWIEKPRIEGTEHYFRQY
jgi:hypothetical protein